MKRLLKLLTIALAFFVLASCGGGGGGDYSMYYLSGTIINLPGGNADYEFRLVSEDGETLSSAIVSSYDNEAYFNISLPYVYREQTYPYSSYFSSFPNYYVEVSPNKSARFLKARLFICRMDDDMVIPVGYFKHQESLTVYYNAVGFLYYCDRATQAFGENSGDGKYDRVDLNLHEGWNWIFEINDRTTNLESWYYTTTNPGGLQFVYNF